MIDLASSEPIRKEGVSDVMGRRSWSSYPGDWFYVNFNEREGFHLFIPSI